MHKLVVFGSLTVAGWVLIGCGPEAGPPFPHPELLDRAGLQYYWDLTLDLDKGETLERLYLRDEALYCLTDRNRVIALDATRGTLRWSARLAAEGIEVFAPVHADGVRVPEEVVGMREILSSRPPSGEPFDAVAFNTVTRVLLFNRRTGEKRREIELGFTCGAGGATDGEQFYAPALRNAYHAVDLAEVVTLWMVSTDGFLSASLREQDGYVYAADETGTVYATGAGRLRGATYRESVGGPVTADFHVDERGVFLPARNGRIHAFARVLTERLWEPVIVEGDLVDPIQVGEKTLFQHAVPSRLYAVDVETGETRWQMPRGREVLAVRDETVYVRDDARYLKVVDEPTGRVRVSLPLAGMELFVPNVETDAIYAASAAGHVFCIRPAEAGLPHPR